MKNIHRIGFLLGISTVLFSCQPAPQENETSSFPHETQLPKVSILPIKEQIFEHFFEVQGAIEAERNVLVTPEVGGLIKTLPVKEGQTIQKGQTIATFDSEIVASNIKELEERLEIAKYMYEKQQSLNNQGVGTEIELKQAEGQYKALLQTISAMKTQKGKFTLTSPFSGYVEEVFPVIGQVAGPTTPIIRLIDLHKMSVKADISETYLPKLNKQSIATIIFPALGNQTIENLPIKRVGKYINPMNRTIGIEIEIPNPKECHVPNLMSVIKIRDYVDSSAIVIPSRLILRDVNQMPYVFTYKNEIAIKTYVKTGLSYGNNTQITSGLTTKDTVIDKGCRGIKNNEKVTVVNDIF